MAGIAYTGLITTALALALESLAFQSVKATDATVILASEPLWAAAFAFFLLGCVGEGGEGESGLG